jgi:two-component system, sensor histidine kinase FlrB
MHMSSGNPLNQSQLEDAFQVFNQVSEQLVDSYQQLQDQVQHLNSELATARTERMRQLAEKELLANRLSQLLDALPAAVVVLDGNGQVEQINPAASELFQEFHTGDHWNRIYSDNFQPDQSGKEQSLQNGRLVSMTERRLDHGKGLILLFLDITETRELQERLNRRQRLSTMGKMAAQLAHQIRTPLSSALLYASHLTNDDLEPERRQRFSERIKVSLQLMERQVNDMLAFTRGGRHSPELFDLVPLLEETIHLLDPALKKTSAGFSFNNQIQGRCIIQGNRDALQGALMNLATNALKHGGDGVELSIELVRTGSRSLRLAFIDTGPGIQQEIVDRIFDPFFTTSSSGTGLGLAVVQSVVLDHNGRISVQSQPGEGSSFYLELPIVAVPDQVSAETKETGASISLPIFRRAAV